MKKYYDFTRVCNELVITCNGEVMLFADVAKLLNSIEQLTADNTTLHAQLAGYVEMIREMGK